MSIEKLKLRLRTSEALHQPKRAPYRPLLLPSSLCAYGGGVVAGHVSWYVSQISHCRYGGRRGVLVIDYWVECCFMECDCRFECLVRTYISCGLNRRLYPHKKINRTDFLDHIAGDGALTPCPLVRCWWCAAICMSRLDTSTGSKHDNTVRYYMVASSQTRVPIHYALLGFFGVHAVYTFLVSQAVSLKFSSSTTAAAASIRTGTSAGA